MCRPAVVDWDGDGRLEVIVGSPTGIKYYKQISMLRPVRFIERTGAENPFNHIDGGSYCGDLSVADWDGDGDLDMLVVYPLSKMNFFEQVNGSLVYVEESESPFPTNYEPDTPSKTFDGGLEWRWPHGFDSHVQSISAKISGVMV